MEALRQEKHYTYADYCAWDDGKRYELINGARYMMSPAPAWEHQNISIQLARFLSNFLDGKPCKVFTAPFDVRLSADKNDDNVVQPDLVVICDRSKLSGTGCLGVPDMVIEILSPSTESWDKVVKFNMYLQAGVREYWMVDLNGKTVQTCILKNGEYVVKAYSENDVVPVHVLEGCAIHLSKVFAN